MSIITISRSFCSKGKVIAEKLAKELGYECISREILIETSDQFNVPEIKLAKAIHDSPSFFEKFTHSKQKYISFINAALLNHLKNDNIVYHGLAGHFFLQNIPHVLKIRAMSTMEDRITEEIMRENMTESAARQKLIDDDKQRHNWSTYVYGIDTTDPELYDMVLNLKLMSVDDCVSIIKNTVKLNSFQPTQESLDILEDMALAASIKATIAEKYSDAVVDSVSGAVTVTITHSASKPEKIKEDIQSTIKNIQGVKRINIHVKSSSMPRTAMHHRT